MPETESESEFEQEQEDAAAAEAAAIGGRVSDEPPMEDDPEADPAQRPLIEAGEGESEGFEMAERELIENASHGDQHSAGRILEDASGYSEDNRAASGGEADEEESADG
jgi:cell division protein FtsN